MSELSNSVTEWIRCCQDGDESAAQKLWDRYFVELLVVARRRLQYSKDSSSDAEDLAIASFASLLIGIRDRRIQASSRGHLWNLLTCIASRQAVDQIRRVKTLRRDAAKATDANDDVPEAQCPEPSSELLVELADEVAMLMSRLPKEDLREIAQLRIDGLSNPEIATRMKKSLSAIERKIRLVKQVWLEEISD